MSNWKKKKHIDAKKKKNEKHKETQYNITLTGSH